MTITIDDIKATIEVIFKQRVATLIAVGTKGRVLFCRKSDKVAFKYSHVADATTYYTKAPLGVGVIVYLDSALETEVGEITEYTAGTSFVIDDTTYTITTENTIVEHGYRVRTFGSAVFNLDDEKELETQIKQIFNGEKYYCCNNNGGAVKVFDLEYSHNLSSVVEQINLIDWNWAFTTETDEQTTIASYCKENKKFGLVYNLESDSMYVVSCNNESASGKLKEDSKKYQLVSTIIKYIDRGYEDFVGKLSLLGAEVKRQFYK